MPSVPRAISARRRRSNAASSVRNRIRPIAVSTTPAAASSRVDTAVSSRIRCTASAAASSATPIRSVRPERKEASMSAADLQITGAQGERDRGNDQVKGHGLRTHEPLDEVDEVQREGKIPEHIAQRSRALERLEMPDE